MDNRNSRRFSTEIDSTVKDIWKVTHQQEGNFDLRTASTEIDARRKAREMAAGTENRFSFGTLLEGDSPVVREDEVSRAMRRRSANVNLHKSIQLLDEAVATPSSLLSSARKTPGKLRHSVYTPQHVSSGSRFDVSATLGISTPGRTFIDNSASARATMGDSTTMDSFMSPRQHSTMGTVPEESLLPADEVTTTNVALLLEEDPGVAACTDLFGGFKQSFNSHGKAGHLLQLLGDYEQLCEENTQLLRRLLKKTVPGQEKFVKTIEMMNLINQERCTWRLLTSLYRDSLHDAQSGEEDEPMITESKVSSEKEVVDSLFEKDASVRQAQLVLDWLEQIAHDQLEEFYDRVEFFTDKMGAWENTLHRLNQRGGFKGSDRPVVSKLDPDAPNRQKRPLADLDAEDEARLAKYIFACIRAGQLDQAQSLCIKVGEGWKAAALEGWRLYHDSNVDGLGPGGTCKRTEGNPHRDLWKAVCWRMATEEKLPLQERAIYAAFSGHLSGLLAVCDTWHDHLWSYMRVLVDQRVEEHLHVHYTGLRPLRTLPEGYWNKRLSVDTVFQELASSARQEVRLQGQERFHMLQRYIILADTDSLIEEMYEWSRDETSPPPTHFLRCMAHLVLFFRTTGATTKDELCVAILEAYVAHLIDGGHSELVATYVATLPPHLQIHAYVSFLKRIRDSDKRRQCLLLAEESGLDVTSITRMVVETIRSEPHAMGDMGPSGGSDTTQTSQEDLEKIDAIDWLVFDPGQRSEAMRQANAIMRSFLATKKLEACRKAFDKIPVGSIDIIIKNTKARTGSPELSPDDDNTVKEYLCIKSYLDANDGFNEWFSHYHGRKPSPPETPPSANYMERVAHEHRIKEYEAELTRWQYTLTQLTKVTEERIFNVLLFVNGGWMVDQHMEGPKEDGGRTHQLRLLRQLCLPQLCFLLHTVLHCTSQYRSCLQLADVIASEQHQLYRVFRKEELQKLLTKLRQSSLELLNANMDPLGYELA